MDRDELEMPSDLPDADQPESVTTAATAAVEPLALSHSQVETFTQCPRRWWLLKRGGVRRAPSESLILGLAVHAAIEADLRLRLAPNENGDLSDAASGRPPDAASGRPPDAPTEPAISPSPAQDSPSATPSPRRERGPGGEDPSSSASSAVSPPSLSSVPSVSSVVNLSGVVNPSGPGDDGPLEAAFAALYAEEDPTGLITPERRALLLAQGRAALRAYERLAPHLRPVEIERDFSFIHPDDSSIIFTGRMDAVTQPDHGTQERTIVDWKVPWRPWAAGEEGRRIQAAAYLWAEARMGWERSARFTFVTFPPAAATTPAAGDEAAPRTVDARPTYRTAAQLSAYAQLVRQTAERIRGWEPWGEDGFPARTSGLCPWCEVRGACPVGQRYVRQRGLTPRVPELPPEEGGADALKSN